MSLGLTPDLVEQAQVVAELMESGELIPKEQQMLETSVYNRTRGVKRNASEMTQTKASQEAEVNHLEHKEKQLKISTVKFTNTTTVEWL